MSDIVAISAIWLRRIGDHAEVLVEMDGRWYLCIRELVDGSFSHIAEASGQTRWRADEVTAPPKEAS